MFIIGEAVIEDSIASERFACDLQKCKGACCTLPGGRGAPLDDSEVAELRKAFPVVKKYLSERHLKAIESTGMVDGEPGNYVTNCVDDRDCVFVLYEDGIARCSLEKAFLNHETDWRKPLSCHLFPIRVSPRDGRQIHYERIMECLPAVDRGRKEDIPMYEFLKAPLIRKFGNQWYDAFQKECLRLEDARL